MTKKLQRHKDTRTLPNSTTHHLCRAQEALRVLGRCRRMSVNDTARGTHSDDVRWLTPMRPLVNTPTGGVPVLESSLSLSLSRGGYGTLTLCVCRYPLVQVSHGMQVSLGDVRQREGCSSGCKRTPALENYIVPSVALLFEHAGLRCCVECVVLY